jgi:adenosine kinase
MRIFVSGSLAYDRVMGFPGKFKDHILPEKIHILNVSFTVESLTENFGGTAGNIAYSLALLDQHPIIIATAGASDFGRYQRWLERHGLSLEGIRVVEGEFTAGAYITTDLSDNQITGFNPGAMKQRADYVVTAGEEPSLGIVAPGNAEDMLAYCRRFKELSFYTIFDPGQSIPILSAEAMVEMIEGSRMLICNDYELAMIMKSTGLDMNELLTRTAYVITTLGEQGARLNSATEEHMVPAAPVEKVVDPTGAGDAFRAAMIHGLAMGRDLLEATRMGVVGASFTVEQRGTQVHRFTPAEFKMRFEMVFGPLQP